MSRSWLQRKRKGELIELAQLARIPNADGYLKDDLVDVLGQRLNLNEPMFGKLSEFSDYYNRTQVGSPVKRDLRSSPSEGLAAVKTRRTLVKRPESEEPLLQKSTPLAVVAPRVVPSPVPVPAPAPVSASRLLSSPVPTPTAIARTPRSLPRRVSEVVSEVDFPASPAQLAEVADQSLQAAATKATELWSRMRIDEVKEFIRENASSVAAIQTLILLIEAAGLQFNTLQTFTLVPTPDTLVNVPDGWRLLTSDWWAPATLWSLTSWVLPFIASYFFNLTLRANTNRKSTEREYPADPLTFNIIKAILAYSAFYLPLVETPVGGQMAFTRAASTRWGPFSTETVDVVRGNVPGGHAGLQIGAVVGILVSLYDAALKK